MCDLYVDVGSKTFRDGKGHRKGKKGQTPDSKVTMICWLLSFFLLDNPIKTINK